MSGGVNEWIGSENLWHGVLILGNKRNYPWKVFQQLWTGLSDNPVSLCRQQILLRHLVIRLWWGIDLFPKCLFWGCDEGKALRRKLFFWLLAGVREQVEACSAAWRWGSELAHCHFCWHSIGQSKSMDEGVYFSHGVGGYREWILVEQWANLPHIKRSKWSSTNSNSVRSWKYMNLLMWTIPATYQALTWACAGLKSHLHCLLAFSTMGILTMGLGCPLCCGAVPCIVGCVEASLTFTF